MKYTVSDDAVRKYADRILSGGPLGTLFPGKMSECDFTETQRELIRKARADKKAKLKAVNTPSEIKKIESPKAEVTVAGIESDKIKPLTKLRKMLYLQSGRCFFCEEILNEEEASIEHLHPISRGGMRSEDNEVVCHRSLNETFGHMELKRKFEFVMKFQGKFRCPQK